MRSSKRNFRSRSGSRRAFGAIAFFALLAARFLPSALGQPPPPEVLFEKDVVYGKAGGVELKLDLARPAKPAAPCPLVVVIHGGGWQLGSKDGYNGMIRDMARRGYVAATLEYRMAPKFAFPSQVNDVKCAVHYLRSRAKELSINPDKAAAIGDSAGGHLALMLGLLDDADGFQTGCCCDGISNKVQAVVNFYGPTDLRVIHADPSTFEEVQKLYHMPPDELLNVFVGAKDRSDPLFWAASPLKYVNKGDPPILTFHGAKDLLVPLEQAKLLHAALRKAGVEEELVVIEEGGHGWAGAEGERTSRLMYEFLEKRLKN